MFITKLYSAISYLHTNVFMQVHFIALIEILSRLKLSKVYFLIHFRFFFAIDDLYLFFQKVLTDRDSEHGDSDQDISANGSPMTRKRGM